jgi:hypothetical protein
MIDDTKLTELRNILCDRFSAEELVELLGLSTFEVFDRFTDECMEIDIKDIL